MPDIFGMTEEIAARRQVLNGFLDEHIYPNEPLFQQRTPEGDELMRELQGKTKAMGYWAPHLAKDAGGMGLGFFGYAYICEILGRSHYAPPAFGAASPNSVTAEVIWQFGTDEQKERWLAPLVAGDIRSCYSMTEPAVSGSDPTGLETTAIRDGDEFVINGRKWFSSGGIGADFALVMAKTDPEAPAHRRFSMFLVPTDLPGFEIERNVAIWGDADSNNPQIRYNDVRVPVTNLLGTQGEGFRVAQRRLGPARIQHCMRALGTAQRAFDLLCQYALDRSVSGGPIADKQSIQFLIADLTIAIQTARLLTLQTAHKIDTGDEARTEVSMIKIHVMDVGCRVVDSAIQVHGALGLTDALPLVAMYKSLRGLRIGDGPDEVHRMVIGRNVLREYRSGGAWDFASG